MRFFTLALATFALSAWAQAPNGQDIYESRCAACHARPVNDRIPSRADLAKLQPQQVSDALTKGIMTVQAQGLTAAQIQAVAAFVAAPPSA